MHNTGPSINPPAKPSLIRKWSGLTSGIQCTSSHAAAQGGGQGWSCERLSAHIFISANAAVAAKGGEKGIPRSCARGSADKYVHARGSATCANICQPNVYMQMLRRETRRAGPGSPVCLPFRLYPFARQRVRLEHFFFSLHLALSRRLAVLKQPALSCSRAQLPRGSTQVRRWRSAQPDAPPQSRPPFFFTPAWFK